MIQRVRTGSPLTAREKTRILGFMETPLELERISAIFERAWTYTQARLPFSQVSDQIVSLLRETLTPPERAQPIEMPTEVAGAHSAPGALQREGIARLRRKLLTDQVRMLDARRGRSGDG